MLDVEIEYLDIIMREENQKILYEHNKQCFECIRITYNELYSFGPYTVRQVYLIHRGVYSDFLLDLFCKDVILENFHLSFEKTIDILFRTGLTI